MRLDSFITEKFNLKSRTYANRIIKDGLVSVDSKTVTQPSKEIIGTEVVELIKKEGFKIYERFYAADNLPVCRIIIPGMSEVYPIDDLAYNNCASGFSLINEILNLTLS